MRKTLSFLFLWLCLFSASILFSTACSGDEKKVASGYTEEQNAWNIKDTVAYLKLLKTWEPEIPVDSAKVNMDGGDQFWYDIVFLSAPKPTFAYTETGADSAACTVNRYSDENGIRLTVNLDSSRELYTQILQRDSMFAVVVDRLDKTYGSGDPAEACGADSVAFVEQCERSKGTVVDQLKRDCNELHLVCTQEIMAKKTADEFLDSTAADLKARCADALGIPLKDMGNGVMDGKVPWRYLNPEIDYGEVVDERDGQVYKTVVIDTLVWMAENLNYADSINSPSLLGKSWCYGNEPDSCTKYGRLYTWGAAIDSVALANDPDNPMQCGDSLLCTDLKYIRGLCMEGWHLPSSAELHTLDDIASTGTPKIAIVDENTEDPTYGPITLRSAYLWESGIDTYGLSLLPAGYYLFDSGEFEDLGSASFFWSLDYAENYAWMYTMYNEKYTFNTHVTINEKYKFAISIRCVKNL